MGLVRIFGGIIAMIGVMVTLYSATYNPKMINENPMAAITIGVLIVIGGIVLYSKAK